MVVLLRNVIGFTIHFATINTIVINIDGTGVGTFTIHFATINTVF